jgi:hypothetical protein
MSITMLLSRNQAILSQKLPEKSRPKPFLSPAFRPISQWTYGGGLSAPAGHRHTPIQIQRTTDKGQSPCSQTPTHFPAFTPGKRRANRATPFVPTICVSPATEISLPKDSKREAHPRPHCSNSPAHNTDSPALNKAKLRPRGAKPLTPPPFAPTNWKQPT